MDSMLMASCAIAFTCLALKLADTVICQPTAGLKNDCQRVTQLGVPCCLLWCCAALVYGYMSGTLPFSSGGAYR